MRPINVFDKPPLPPGMCMKCRNGDQTRKFFVDLGFDTEYEGAMYLCDTCITEIGLTSNIFMTYGQHRAVLSLIEEELEAAHTRLNMYNNFGDTFQKITSNDLQTFLENLEWVNNVNVERSRSELSIESSGNLAGNESTVDDSNSKSDNDTEQSKPDDLRTAGIDPPIFTIPTFS